MFPLGCTSFIYMSKCMVYCPSYWLMSMRKLMGACGQAIAYRCLDKTSSLCHMWVPPRASHNLRPSRAAIAFVTVWTSHLGDSCTGVAHLYSKTLFIHLSALNLMLRQYHLLPRLLNSKTTYFCSNIFIAPYSLHK